MGNSAITFIRETIFYALAVYGCRIPYALPNAKLAVFLIIGFRTGAMRHFRDVIRGVLALGNAYGILHIYVLRPSSYKIWKIYRILSSYWSVEFIDTLVAQF